MGDHADDAVRYFFNNLGRTQRKPKSRIYPAATRAVEHEQKQKQRKKGNAMNNQSLFAPIYDDAVMMHKCVYHDNSCGNAYNTEYTFKSAIAVEVGDFVVARTKGWYQVVSVVETNVAIPVEEDRRYNWIVAKIDMQSYDTIIEWEQKLVDEITKKRVHNMRQQMIAALGVQPNELTTLLSYDDTEQGNDNVT